MTKRGEKITEEAKLLEIRLIVEERHADAETIRFLRVSLGTTQGTLKRIYADNMALRRELGLEAFEAIG